MNVYDFDNTIYRGESGIDIFLHYFKKDPKLLRYFPMVAGGIYRYKRGLLTIDGALEKYSPVIVGYVRENVDIQKEVKNFWDTHMNRIKPLYFRLRTQDDLILSASPEQMLEEVCRRLGIKRYIGTRYDEESSCVTWFNFRENKVKAFREQFPDTRIEKFYTDSYNDKPMMEISDQVFLVKGNQVEQIK